MGMFCDSGSTKPQPCLPGHHCPRPERQEECQANTYAYCSGQLQCSPCPPNSQPSSDRSSCVCDPGYFSIFALELEVAAAEGAAGSADREWRDQPTLPTLLFEDDGELMADNSSQSLPQCTLYSHVCVPGSELNTIPGVANITAHATSTGVFTFATVADFEAYAHAVPSSAVHRRLAADAASDTADAVVGGSSGHVSNAVQVDCASTNRGAHCLSCTAAAPGSRCRAMNGDGWCSATGACAAECAEGCSEALRGDGFCDPACRDEWCAFDGGDCEGSICFGKAGMPVTEADGCAVHGTAEGRVNGGTLEACRAACAAEAQCMSFLYEEGRLACFLQNKVYTTYLPPDRDGGESQSDDGGGEAPAVLYDVYFKVRCDGVGSVAPPCNGECGCDTSAALEGASPLLGSLLRLEPGHWPVHTSLGGWRRYEVEEIRSGAR